MPSRTPDPVAVSSAHRHPFAFRLLPCLAVLLAFGLYAYGLESKSLWFDEMGTLTGSGWAGSWLDTLRKPIGIPLIPKPPLFFLITRLFLILDESVFLLRLPAVVFAILSVPLAYVLGKALLDRWAGLLGGLLLAIAPLQIRYAQEARMYTLLVFLSLLSLVLFWRAIGTGRTRWWLGWVIACTLNLYTHLFAALPLGVMVLFACWVRVRNPSQYRFSWRQLAWSLAAILLFVSPMIPPIIRGLRSGEGFGGVAAHDWGPIKFLHTLRIVCGGHWAGLAGCGFLVLVAAGVLWTRDRDVLGLIAGWIVLPVLTVLVLPFGHELCIRYFLFGLPVVLLLVAYGLGVVWQGLLAWAARRTWRPRQQRAIVSLGAALMVLALASSHLPSLHALQDETKQRWRLATRLVHDIAQEGDQVLVPRELQQRGVLFYAEQWDEQTGPINANHVYVIPQDLSDYELPPHDGRHIWLIVPYKPRFLPGGEFDASIQPEHHLSEPLMLGSTDVPLDQHIVAPVSSGRVAVVRVEGPPPPAIRFWTDDEQVAPGGCTWLNWDVDNVREVYLNGEGVVGSDRRLVCPGVSTSYRLRVLLLDESTLVETVKIAVSIP